MNPIPSKRGFCGAKKPLSTLVGAMVGCSLRSTFIFPKLLPSLLDLVSAFSRARRTLALRAPLGLSLCVCVGSLRAFGTEGKGGGTALRKGTTKDSYGERNPQSRGNGRHRILWRYFGPCPPSLQSQPLRAPKSSNTIPQTQTPETYGSIYASIPIPTSKGPHPLVPPSRILLPAHYAPNGWCPIPTLSFAYSYASPPQYTPYLTFSYIPQKTPLCTSMPSPTSRPRAQL